MINLIKKYKVTIIISIIVCLFLLYFLMSGKNEEITNQNKIVDGDLINTSIKHISEKVKEANIKNGVSNEPNMDISIDELIKYSNKGASLIGYFDSNNYNIGYLYNCDHINKFMYKCPEEGFLDFTQQFTSSGSIILNKSKDSYFMNDGNKISIYKSRQNFILILSGNE